MFIDITNPINFDMMVRLYDFTINQNNNVLYMQDHDGVFKHDWIKCDSVEMRLRYDTMPNRSYSQSQILDLIHHNMMRDGQPPTGFTIIMVYANNSIKEEWRIGIPQNVHTTISRNLNFYFDLRKEGV